MMAPDHICRYISRNMIEHTNTIPRLTFGLFQKIKIETGSAAIMKGQGVDVLVYTAWEVTHLLTVLKFDTTAKT